MTIRNGSAARFSRSGAAALAFTVLAAVAPPAWAQSAQAVPGTSVSLVAPQGFEPASGFAGLMNKQSQASVLVVEMPAEAHAQIMTLFSDLATAKTNFAKQNVDVARIEQLDGKAGQVPLISGTQTVGSAKLDKWVSLFKGAKTVMITVQAPESAKLQTDEVKKLMASVSLGREPTIQEKLSSLPFAIQAAEPFRVVDTIGGAGVLMTVGDKNTDPTASQPVMITAYQMSAPVSAEQLETISDALLKQTNELQAAAVKEKKRVPFAGQSGVLTTGTFKHSNGSEKAFSQYIAVGPDGKFVRLIAMADQSQMSKLQPAIEKTAGSVAFSGK